MLLCYTSVLKGTKLKDGVNLNRSDECFVCFCFHDAFIFNRDEMGLGKTIQCITLIW